MGMSVAHCLLTIPNKPYTVTVISEFFSPGTLSDRSVGLWGPYLPGCPEEGPDFQKVLRWGNETKERLWKMMQESPYNEWAVYVSQVWMLSTEAVFPVTDCPYREICDDLATVARTPSHPFPEGYNSALRYSTPQIVPARYLKHLTEQVSQLGGTFVRQTVTDIHQLQKSYHQPIDVIVNCLGLGARPVVKDEELLPIRGVLVKLPPIPKYLLRAYECLVEGKVTYAVFRPDCTLLGGTAHIGDWTKQNTEQEIKDILDRNIKMLPDLAKYPYVSDWSGHRPGRSVVRLEKDVTLTDVPVIHNYGHGGAGWSLHWGCATDVLELIEQHFGKSKL